MKNFNLKYFLGANSANGFVSEFGSNCDTRFKTYIIKGGPGTGKSSFMKKIAKRAKENNEKVTVCPCSSDPDSLDAVILDDKKIMLLDGTAPHTVDPVYPAVCQEILNFGDFWDCEKLKNKDEVIKITDYNKTLHKTASSYIIAAGDLLFDSLKTAESCTDVKKVEHFSKKLCQRFIPENVGQGRETIRFLSTVTPKGIVSFPETVTENFENIIIIKDEFFNISSKILKYVRDFALKSGYEIITLKNPLFPDLIDHIIIPDLSFSIVSENRFIKFDITARRIHSRRFVDSRLLHHSKNRIKFNNKAADMLLNAAFNTLSQAKTVHDELEKHYINAMNFEKINSFTDMFCNKLF